MIPYARQDIDKKDLKAVVRALKKDLITTGPLVEEFERKLASYISCETIVVNSGTAALHAAYHAVGIRPGDEIITPPNTFIATQATAALLGGVIRFADIDPKTGLISIDQLERLITKRTRAIVVVDYAGQAINLKPIREIIDNRNIVIIEDAAHSLGTTYANVRVGSQADITTFSFFATKNITTGEGGAISSPHPDMLKRAKIFSRQGLIREPSDFRLNPDGPWHQEVHDFGLNYRLPDILCALGISQLSKIEIFKHRRKKFVNTYRSILAQNARIDLIDEIENCDPMWHLMPILVDKTVRRRTFEKLRNQGIGVQINYFPANRHPVFANLSDARSKLPNSDTFYSREISLPLHMRMSEKLIVKICEHVNNAIDESSRE